MGIGRGDSAVRTIGHEPGADEAASGVGPDPPRPDGRQDGRDQRTPTSTSAGCRKTSACRSASPRPGRRTSAPPVRLPTSSCSTSASTRYRCAGRSTTSGQAPTRPGATRTRSSFSVLTRDVGLRRPGGGLGEVPLGARRVREPHRRHDEAKSRARHARADDPPAAGARPLRLLRGPPRLVGRPHRLPHRRPRRRLRDRGHRREVPRQGSRARRPSGSTRSPAPT